MPAKDFGENLKKEMGFQGIERKQMAEKANVSLSALASYIRGEKAPPIDIAARLADALDVSVDYLLGRTKRKEVQTSDDKMYLALAMTENGCSTETVLKIIDRFKELSGTGGEHAGKG